MARRAGSRGDPPEGVKEELAPPPPPPQSCLTPLPRVKAREGFVPGGFEIVRSSRGRNASPGRGVPPALAIVVDIVHPWRVIIHAMARSIIAVPPPPTRGPGGEFVPGCPRSLGRPTATTSSTSRWVGPDESHRRFAGSASGAGRYRGGGRRDRGRFSRRRWMTLVSLLPAWLLLRPPVPPPLHLR